MPPTRNRGEQAQSFHDMSAIPQATRPVCASLLQQQTSGLHHHRSTERVLFCDEYSSGSIPLHSLNVGSLSHEPIFRRDASSERESPQPNSVSETVVPSSTIYEPVANSLASVRGALDSSPGPLALRCEQTRDSAATDCHIDEESATLVDFDDGPHDDPCGSGNTSDTPLLNDISDNRSFFANVLKRLNAYPSKWHRHKLPSELEDFQEVFSSAIALEISLVFHTICIVGSLSLLAFLGVYAFGFAFIFSAGARAQQETIYKVFETIFEVLYIIAVFFAGIISPAAYGYACLGLHVTAKRSEMSDNPLLIRQVYAPASLTFCAASYFLGLVTFFTVTVHYLRDKPAYDFPPYFAIMDFPLASFILFFMFTYFTAKEMLEKLVFRFSANEKFFAQHLRLYRTYVGLHMVTLIVSIGIFVARIATRSLFSHSAPDIPSLVFVLISGAGQALMAFIFPLARVEIYVAYDPDSSDVV